MKCFLKIDSDIIINMEMIIAVKGVYQEDDKYKIKILTLDDQYAAITKDTKEEAGKAYKELLKYADIRVVEI